MAANKKHKPLPPLTPSDIARFWKFVDVRGPDECWPWKGGKHHRDHAGHFWLAGKTVIADRVAFLLQKGFDAFPLMVTNTCHSDACCNGSHLKSETHEEIGLDTWNRVVEPNRPEFVLKPRHPEAQFLPVPVMPRTIPSKPEEWRDVVGYEGLYEVSSRGQIRSLGTFKKTQHHMLLKISKNRKTGYLMLSLSKDGIQSSYTLHALVANAFLGPRPEDQQINHKDGYKDNCIDENLEYLSALDNRLHAQHVLKNLPAGLRNGKYTKPEATPRGESHGMSVLNEEKVRDIRSHHATKTVSIKALSREYGVDPYTIQSVIRGRTWKHVKQIE